MRKRTSGRRGRKLVAVALKHYAGQGTGSKRASFYEIRRRLCDSSTKRNKRKAGHAHSDGLDTAEASVNDRAFIGGNAQIHGNAAVYDGAQVFGHAKV